MSEKFPFSLIKLSRGARKLTGDFWQLFWQSFQL